MPTVTVPNTPTTLKTIIDTYDATYLQSVEEGTTANPNEKISVKLTNNHSTAIVYVDFYWSTVSDSNKWLVISASWWNDVFEIKRRNVNDLWELSDVKIVASAENDSLDVAVTIS